MGYLFVDRILSIGRADGSLRARGLKAVSRGDPFLRQAANGEWLLSPSFLAEAVGQLAAWAAMSEGGFRRRPVAGLTAAVEVQGCARAGDLVLLSVKIESLDDDAVHYHGEARLGGKAIVTLTSSVGPLLPMENFDDPREVERKFREIFRPDREDSPPPGEESPAPSFAPARDADHPAIDAVIERDAERILAVTCVSQSAPYLAGHFPRDPVLPATLLFDAQVALAGELAGPDFRVARLCDLKMRDFVRPGSRLISEVRVRERGPELVSAQLTGRLGSRTISSGRVELVPAGGR